MVSRSIASTNSSLTVEGALNGMSVISMFTEGQLRAICDALGDTAIGLTGSEIAELLAQCGIPDPGPITKRHRLYEALYAKQQRDRCGNCVVVFIHAAMDPARWLSKPERFEQLRYRLNEALAFCGYTLGEDGKLRVTKAARTLSEAQQRANRLRQELQRRRVHADVLKFCRGELLQENYFHAVLEATKSVAEKIREKTGLTSDGSKLVDEAFGLSKGMPLLAFNSLRTESERMEHTGLMSLMKGMFGVFRNVTAHAPKIFWPINEQDALDLLTLASYLHRRLDEAVPTPALRRMVND